MFCTFEQYQQHDFTKPLKLNKYMWYDFNILQGQYLEQQDDRWFMPLTPWDHLGIIKIPDHWTYHQLVWWLGIFESKRDVQRKGWAKPIPEGWSEVSIGKRRITVLRCHELKATNPLIWTPDIERQLEEGYASNDFLLIGEAHALLEKKLHEMLNSENNAQDSPV